MKKHFFFPVAILSLISFVSEAQWSGGVYIKKATDNRPRTDVSQKGPVTASLDYQFSRFSSIGVMGTYGKATVPYYEYSSLSDIPSFSGSIENWSVMFNMMNYMPTYSNYVNPYIRTAIGVNNWKQNYIYGDGEKAAVVDDPSSLAYQVSVGSRFNFSQNAGFYVEADYGKSILNGGLTFSF